MKVRLISYTEAYDNDPVAVKKPDVESLIAYCARVSNPENQSNHETAEKLIRYLIKNKHWSPLEMVNACLEIETTRDIARQILRHRSFSFQEFSQRYADPTKTLPFEAKEARLQDPKNRQNSVSLDFNIEDQRRLNEDFSMKQHTLWKQAEEIYSWAISKGVAKEQARAVFPEGMTPSRLYMNGTLRSWVHYIELRSANGTQKEHQDIAIACAVEIAKIFPIGFECK